VKIVPVQRFASAALKGDEMGRAKKQIVAVNADNKVRHG
jgi:hypothetical protein